MMLSVGARCAEFGRQEVKRWVQFVLAFTAYVDLTAS